MGLLVVCRYISLSEYRTLYIVVSECNVEYCSFLQIRCKKIVQCPPLPLAPDSWPVHSARWQVLIPCRVTLSFLLPLYISFHSTPATLTMLIMFVGRWQVLISCRVTILPPTVLTPTVHFFSFHSTLWRKSFLSFSLESKLSLSCSWYASLKNI